MLQALIQSPPSVHSGKEKQRGLQLEQCFEKSVMSMRKHRRRLRIALWLHYCEYPDSTELGVCPVASVLISVQHGAFTCVFFLEDFTIQRI